MQRLLSFFPAQSFTLITIVLLAFAACKPDDKKHEEITDLPIGNHAVMVINEGNYLTGNASITYYNPLTGNVFEDIFLNQNSRPLGDVAQSMVAIDGYGYIVVNNSNKIEVVDLVDFKSVATITGLTSPRYILPLGDGRAYVSDLYADQLNIINLNTNTVVGNITLPGWTEQMLLANGKVLVANYDSQRVEIVNTTTDTKTGHINVVGHPLDMVLDKQGQLWVLGQKEGSQAAALNRVNPTTESVELTLPFPSTESPSRLVIDPAGDFLYYLNNQGVFKMATTATSLPATPLVEKAGRNFYGLGISPDNLQLYLADALDYNQRSNVYIYSLPAAEPTDTFKTGIISGGFYFYPR